MGGTWLAWSDGLKRIHAQTFGEVPVSLYVGLIAPVINIAVAMVAQLAWTMLRRGRVGALAA